MGRMGPERFDDYSMKRGGGSSIFQYSFCFDKLGFFLLWAQIGVGPNKKLFGTSYCTTLGHILP